MHSLIYAGLSRCHGQQQPSESMNRHLKRGMLSPLTADMRLESLLVVWCEHILPKYEHEYMLDNQKSGR
jgi:hypothetical protein